MRTGGASSGFRRRPRGRRKKLPERKGETGVIPLTPVARSGQPVPALGWANRERSSIPERGKPGAILALALIHHLVISNNVPLRLVSDFFASMTAALVIEFVSKSDDRVKTLLATRPDIFPDYTRQGFEEAFTERWSIEAAAELGGPDRVLYCLRRRP